MPQDSDRQGETPPSAPSSGRVSSDVLREQQAIATAMMIGQQMRRAERKQAYGLAIRIGLFVFGAGLFGLVVLFGYTRLAKEAFNPAVYLILLALVSAGGAAGAYWGYAESRRQSDD